MKALILAAGEGKRLRPLTEDRPKCLIEIGNKPILGYQLEALSQNGINDVTLVLGYKRRKVEDYIKDAQWDRVINFNLIYNNEFAVTNSSYSFYLAYTAIVGSHVVYLNSDLIFFPALLHRLLTAGHANTMVVDSEITLDRSMQQVKVDKGIIVEMTKDPTREMDGKATGLAKFSPLGSAAFAARIEAAIGAGNRKNWFYSFIADCLAEVELFALDKQDLFLEEVNTMDDLAKIKRKIDG